MHSHEMLSNAIPHFLSVCLSVIQVLVMTCHIFLYILKRKILLLSKINLVVFDDCHLAVGDHPYCEIMKVRHCSGCRNVLSLVRRQCMTPVPSSLFHACAVF